ncbi:MAG: SpoIIIAH-like family protein [Clostridium sp.]|nr:SpoIIIAH-like family protein [Acetatifactor muris]MCM1562000.1 SpoIIIAH-like family protein [Clostridium sp.]
MKNLVKKNQLMITALAVMIAIAGYLQFAGANLEEEYLTVDDADVVNPVDSTGVITENYRAGSIDSSTDVDGLLDLSEDDLLSAGFMEIESLDSDVDVIMDDYLSEGMQVAEVTPESGEIPGEAVFTSTTGVAVLSDAKLLKEQTRARNKETLMQIIGSDGLTDEQKQDAVDSMVAMTVIAEKESAAEILLEAKGFSDVVVSIAGDMADVVVNAVELTDVQRAQIEDIIMRKTDIAAENIVISTVVE